MVIAAPIIPGLSLAPIEGSIEGWNAFVLSRAALGRVAGLLHGGRLQFERLRLPRSECRLHVGRLLYVPGGTKHVVPDGVGFALALGGTLAAATHRGLFLRRAPLEASVARLLAEHTGLDRLVMPARLEGAGDDPEIAPILDSQSLAFAVNRSGLQQERAIVRRKLDALAVRGHG
jgi:hypothetical protein